MTLGAAAAGEKDWLSRPPIWMKCPVYVWPGPQRALLHEGLALAQVTATQMKSVHTSLPTHPATEQKILCEWMESLSLTWGHPGFGVGGEVHCLLPF